jgi:hypothetical protein
MKTWSINRSQGAVEVIKIVCDFCREECKREYYCGAPPYSADISLRWEGIITCSKCWENEFDTYISLDTLEY